ncbi:MAG TPA: RHS repeat-associated core domain-containing protein [Bryobacteraceae bacterium]|jgi:RHS repeat-associated protein|nr:RHS repeat-associated core domain-containing protein [Bryobacteraceae bacterium]
MSTFCRYSLFRFVLALFVLGLASAYADVITITFENLPDAFFFNGDGQNIGTFYPGLTFGPNVTGLSVSRFGGYDDSGFPPHSGDVVIWDASDSTITIDFASSIESFGIWYTSFDPLTLQAFDGSNNLLGTVEGDPNTDGTTGTDTLLSFAGSGISSVTLTSSPGLFTLDDLSYEPGVSAVPEPSAFVLLASALIGFFLCRSVNRSSVTAPFKSLPPRSKRGTSAFLCVLAAGVVSSGFGAKAASGSVYQLSGTLQWNSTSGADLINANGKSFKITVTITNLTPTPVSDPNGTRDDYAGTGTLQIGSQTIPLNSTDTAFFHSSSHAGDVTNFFLFPTSGSPAFYLPAVNFAGDANAILSPPPVYSPPVSFNLASLVVPAPSGVPSANAIYTIVNANFSSPVTIFSDLTGTFTPGGYIVGQYSPGNTFTIGAAFSVVGQNYTLNLIQTLMSFSSGVNNMNVGLYTDSGGIPGTLLESWSLVNVLPPAPSIITLTSVVNPILMAGQRYWITAAMADPTSVGVWWINAIGDGLQGFASSSLNGATFTPGANTVFGFHAFAVAGIGSSSNVPPAATFFGGSTSAINPTLFVAEPVNSAIGNYYSSQIDLAVRGRGLNFQFTRYYNSLDSYAGPMGNGWTHTFNAFLTNNTQTGQVNVKQSNGSVMSFSAIGGGVYVPQTVGVADILSEVADGTFTLTRKNQTVLTFSSAGRLTSIQDRNGNTLTLTYSSGNLSSLSDTGGRMYTFSYDGNNHLISLLDPLGRIIRYAYDAAGNLVSSQNALGGTTQFAYDTNNRMTSATDPRGVVYVQNTYDSQGRVTVQKNGKSAATTFAYNTPATNITSITDPLGSVTQHVYDNSLRIVQVVNPQGGTVGYAYGSNNNKTAITTANGQTTHFAYDANGNVTSVTNPLGNTASFTYDGKNNILTATNPAGAMTTFGYDASGNLLRIQDAAGNKSGFNYDASGELISRTDALGNTSTLAYDAVGDLTTVNNALGNQMKFAYDAISRMTSVTDGNGHTFGLTYDALGRRTKTTDALGHQTQSAYDAVGNLLTVIDANGNPTAYQYDNVNNLVLVTDALGNKTSYGYDADNNRTSFTNANGNTTTYVYNSLNRRTKITDPLGLFSSYSYDAAGNVVSMRDANGKTSSFTYDVLNRPAAQTYADGNVISYAYDVNGNRTSMQDSHGTTVYTYDVLNRLAQVASGGGSLVKYSYDGVGHRTALTYPDGRVVGYTYDAASRLSQVTDWVGRKTTYSYDAAGNRVAVAIGNGASSSYSYDNSNRLLAIVNRGAGKVLTSFSYGLDSAGNRTQLVDVSGGLTQYRYDGLNRLISWTTPSSQVTSYVYDAIGNRVSMTSSAGVTAYTYDVGDRILAAGTSSFTYDGNGNRLTKTTGATTINYSFDTLNRLIAVSGGGVATQYGWDGDGNRVSQQVGSAAYQYSLDVARRNVAVLNENGPDGNIDFQYGHALLSGSSSSLEQFYQFDGVGSTSDVTDGTDSLKASYAYDPWGKLLNPIDALGTKDKFKFTGEALDPQTGLYYLRARFYDPTVGRFISRDRLSGVARIPATANRYSYALNNPLALTDRSGRSAELVGTGDVSIHSGAILSNLGLGGLVSGDLGFTPPVGSGPGLLPPPGLRQLPPQPSGPIAIADNPKPDNPSGPYSDCDFEPCSPPPCNSYIGCGGLTDVGFGPGASSGDDWGFLGGTSDISNDPFQNYLNNVPDPFDDDLGPYDAGSTSAPLDPFGGGDDWDDSAMVAPQTPVPGGSKAVSPSRLGNLAAKAGLPMPVEPALGFARRAAVISANSIGTSSREPDAIRTASSLFQDSSRVSNASSPAKSKQ